MECRDQLIRKFCNQATFFVEELKQPPAVSATGGIYNFQGNVGAVLTGPYATAHVHIDAIGAARLVEALEGLRDALPKAADMAPDAREQSAELVSDIIVAARADKPNGLTLTGLLMGLGMGVQTIASVRPAWDAVLHAAKAIGIPLP
jgi:ornithine cyclodeaminase/alanine dehydrogenase-like protein (mu-crystallin family)